MRWLVLVVASCCLAVSCQNPSRDSGSGPEPLICTPDQEGGCLCNGEWGGVVCGDAIDDDCDGVDEVCPTTLPARLIRAPRWNCEGTPPESVLAWARIDQGGGYFKDGGCFLFFEGSEDEFYVTTTGLARASTEGACRTLEGCTCPSTDGAPSHDQRMYAFTLHGAPEDCAEIILVDGGGEDQPVGNECRRYLWPVLHDDGMGYSYLTNIESDLRDRLRFFDTVEIACAGSTPSESHPFASLVTSTVSLNPAYVGLGTN